MRMRDARNTSVIKFQTDNTRLLAILRLGDLFKLQLKPVNFTRRTIHEQFELVLLFIHDALYNSKDDRTAPFDEQLPRSRSQLILCCIPAPYSQIRVSLHYSRPCVVYSSPTPIALFLINTPFPSSLSTHSRLSPLARSRISRCNPFR